VKQPSKNAILSRLSTRVFGTPLLIQPEKLAVILQSDVGPRLTGATFEVEGLPEAPAAKSKNERSERKDYWVTSDGIAIIDVSGSLVNRSSWMDAWSGMTSYNQIQEEVADAVADSLIKGIVLRIDSCGGECAGCYDLADYLYSVRGAKPLWAAVDDQAFSAAYMIASACSKIFVSRTGGVGSVGVVAMHLDQSSYDEKVGLKYTALYAGDHKTDFNSHKPLSDAAKTELQGEIDRLYGMFVESVARNRGLSAKHIAGTEARLFFGDRAIEARMADELLPFSQVVDQMSATVGPRQSSLRMEAPAVPVQGSAELAPDAPEVAPNADYNDSDSEDQDDLDDLEDVINNIPVPEEPEEEEETDMSQQVENPATQTSAPAPAVASAEEVMELCAIAGLDLSAAQELVSKRLSSADLRAELRRMKQEAQPKGISSVLPPSGGSAAAIEKLAAAAKAATEGGGSFHREFAARLAANPQAYEQYLAANPAQTRGKED
jgi:signal peptide peptidase SppA